MCLIAFAWKVSDSHPLLVAANRDEFYARPSAPAAFWDDQPQVLAGRDLQAGGTWFGLGAGGRFAAITNIRDPDGAGAAPRSRGELTTEYLRGEVRPGEYLAEVAGRISAYQGFNLLAGTTDELWYLQGVAGGEPQRLAPGVYGLSNAALDVPWPKVRIAKERLTALAASGTAPDHAQLAACVASHDTAAPEDLVGHGLVGEMAERLSAQFIVTESYGTRCRSTVIGAADGGLSFCEERFNERGQADGRSEFRIGRRAAINP